MKTLGIRGLGVGDAAELSAILSASGEEYQRYFTPFPFDAASLRGRLQRAREDRYWGLCVDGQLAGFFMLRGFDEGYAVPSYGVSIAENYANRGLLKLSLSFALSWCRLNGIEHVMLKVHQDNTIAKREYERFGFVFDRLDPPSGQLVYVRQLGPLPA